MKERDISGREDNTRGEREMGMVQLSLSLERLDAGFDGIRPSVSLLRERGELHALLMSLAPAKVSGGLVLRYESLGLYKYISHLSVIQE